MTSLGQVVGALLDENTGRVGSYTVTLTREGQVRTSWRAYFTPRSWRIDSGDRSEASDGEAHRSKDGRGISQVGFRADYRPLELRLVHPLLLPVWGRGQDAYALHEVSGEEANTATVSLMLRQQPSGPVVGEMVVDLSLGIVRKLTTPDLSVEMGEHWGTSLDAPGFRLED